MARTTIEWCDEVWNPVTGCTKVSQGCKHCYAERIAQRFWGERKFTDVRIHPERLKDPLRLKDPRRVFVNSMSDLFHPDVPDKFIAAIFGIMAACSQHTFIILTKRPERCREWFRKFGEEYSGMEIARCWAYSIRLGGIPDFDTWPGARVWPIPNVWLGVSVENQKAADERIPILVQVPAVIKFVSVEPMLEAITLWPDFYHPSYAGPQWVICGCESGSGARPMQMDWARSIRDQCVSTSVPFFLKQLRIDSKIVKMPELDGRQWAEYPKAQNGKS